MSHHRCQCAFSDRRPDTCCSQVNTNQVSWVSFFFLLNIFSIDMKLYIFICVFKRILPNAYFAKPITVIIELNIEATKLILILINFSHKIFTMTAIEMGTSVCDAIELLHPYQILSMLGSCSIHLYYALPIVHFNHYNIH
jgi:hypothetical protein